MPLIGSEISDGATENARPENAGRPEMQGVQENALIYSGGKCGTIECGKLACE